MNIIEPFLKKKKGNLAICDMMYLESIMLNEVSHRERQTLHYLTYNMESLRKKPESRKQIRRVIVKGWEVTKMGKGYKWSKGTNSQLQAEYILGN